MALGSTRGLKAAAAYRADNLITFKSQLSRNPGSLNLLDLLGPA
jgi:hypothetical protein